MIKVGIVGATGYTGLELLRLLASHAEVEVSVVTSNAEQGKNLCDVFPGLNGHYTITFEPHDSEALKQCQLVFFATPHATAMNYVPALLDAGCKVIDLSADFRLKDAKLWQQWYDVEHAAEGLLAEAVYGLPELNREAISNATLVANPGCYPTAVSLALIPALQNNLINTSGIIADAKSGVSGAGRKAAMATLHAEVSESFKAYSVGGHRHLPEIAQTLTVAANDKPVQLVFVPHLVPMNRGILATVYVEPLEEGNDWQQIYASYYDQEPFVELLPAGQYPETRNVRGTNMCQLALQVPPADSNRLVVLAAIDNLVKGAAGQAIQNMNLMFGFPETQSLRLPALVP